MEGKKVRHWVDQLGQSAVERQLGVPVLGASWLSQRTRHWPGSLGLGSSTAAMASQKRATGVIRKIKRGARRGAISVEKANQRDYGGSE